LTNLKNLSIVIIKSGTGHSDKWIWNKYTAIWKHSKAECNLWFMMCFCLSVSLSMCVFRKSLDSTLLIKQVLGLPKITCSITNTRLISPEENKVSIMGPRPCHWPYEKVILDIFEMRFCWLYEYFYRIFFWKIKFWFFSWLKIALKGVFENTEKCSPFP
jgi:hypothetical protein